MLNQQILNEPIGPNGVYGSVTVSIVEGKLVTSLNLSPKAVLDAAAKKIGGPVPAEVATFIEAAVGLS